MHCLVLLPKLEHHRQTMTATILLNFFTKMFFLLKFSIEIHYLVIANCIFNLFLLYRCTQDGQTYKKKHVVSFWPAPPFWVACGGEVKGTSCTQWCCSKCLPQVFSTEDDSYFCALRGVLVEKPNFSERNNHRILLLTLIYFWRFCNQRQVFAKQVGHKKLFPSILNFYTFVKNLFKIRWMALILYYDCSSMIEKALWLDSKCSDEIYQQISSFCTWILKVWQHTGTFIEADTVVATRWWLQWLRVFRLDT